MLKRSVARQLVAIMFLMLVAILFGFGRITLDSLEVYRTQTMVRELATADAIFFRVLDDLQAAVERGQTALLSEADPAPTLTAVHKAQDDGRQAAMAAMAPLAAYGLKADRQQAEALWQAVTAEEPQLAQLGSRPLGNRFLARSQPWKTAAQNLAGFWRDHADRLAAQVAGQSAPLAALVAVRQASAELRDDYGTICPLLRPSIDSNHTMTADVAARYRDAVSSYRGTLRRLDHQLAYGTPQPALISAAKAAGASLSETQGKLDGLVGRLDDSGKPFISGSEFTALCASPQAAISALGRAALDLESNYALNQSTAALRQLVIAGSAFVIILLLGLVGVTMTLRRLAQPLMVLTEIIGSLVRRDWTVSIPWTKRRDEIGTLANALELFKAAGLQSERLAKEAADAHAAEQRLKAEQAAADAEAAAAEKRRLAEDLEQAERERRQAREMAAAIRDFEAEVAAVIGAIAGTADGLRSNARSLSDLAAQTAAQAHDLGSSAEEATANVQTVASAADQLAATSKEVGRQARSSADMSHQAVAVAAETHHNVQALETAAHSIGEIVRLIEEIAGQTNLLALNATIEAARAGDAGKGFAVVASEVKALAGQTAKATERIVTEIGAIQTTTNATVAAIAGIGGTIGRMSEASSAIAAAVEQQIAATTEIARGVDEAANGTTEVTSGIRVVGGAARATGDASSGLLNEAEQLGTQADHLRAAVDKFLKTVAIAG